MANSKKNACKLSRSDICEEHLTQSPKSDDISFFITSSWFFLSRLRYYEIPITYIKSNVWRSVRGINMKTLGVKRLRNELTSNNFDFCNEGNALFSCQSRGMSLWYRSWCHTISAFRRHLVLAQVTRPSGNKITVKILDKLFSIMRSFNILGLTKKKVT